MIDPCVTPVSERGAAQRPRPRLLYLVTEDWYFCSHRLPMACAARDAGFRVAVATRCTDHAAEIRAHGFDVRSARVSSASRL